MQISGNTVIIIIKIEFRNFIYNLVVSDQNFEIYIS